LKIEGCHEVSAADRYGRKDYFFFFFFHRLCGKDMKLSISGGLFTASFRSACLPEVTTRTDF
jgi:hypothetical protein